MPKNPFVTRRRGMARRLVAAPAPSATRRNFGVRSAPRDADESGNTHETSPVSGGFPMPRFPEASAAGSGSQKWLQVLVNDRRDILDRAIGDAAGGDVRGSIRWLSPRREDDHAEYADAEFLALLGVELPRRPLTDFWPARGPRWDALGRTKSGHLILVEAKAHESEVASDCAATGAMAQARITKSLREVREHYGAEPGCDWMRGYYQYANRLAHLYLLREVNGIPATLVFLYLCGDSKNGVASRASWDRVRRRIHRALGLPESMPGVVEAFVETKGLTRATARGRANR